MPWTGAGYRSLEQFRTAETITKPQSKNDEPGGHEPEGGDNETCECGIAVPGQSGGKKNKIYSRQRSFSNLNKVRAQESVSTFKIKVSCGIPFT